jgi:hypothetical protein
MPLFKSIQDLSGGLAGLLQGAKGLLDKAGGEGMGQGFKGMVQGALDLNIEGLMQQADAHLGTGVMKLAGAGDTESVEIVVRFRNYAWERLEDMTRMRDIINKFISVDMLEVKEAVREMDELCASKEPEVVCSERERVLQDEIDKLKKMARRMNAFLQDEEALLGAEEEADTAVPEAVASVAEAVPEPVPARQIVTAPGKYPRLPNPSV